MHYLTMGLLTVMTVFTYTHTHAFSLPSQTIEAYDCPHCEELSVDTLRSSWEIQTKPQPEAYPSRRSYAYALKASAAELQTGIPILTTANEAVLVIKPLQKEKMPELVLINSQHKQFSLQEASWHFGPIDHESVLPKQYNLQLKPELGHGQFLIQSTKKINDPDKMYLIHVYDKHSMLGLEIVPSSSHYQYGDTFKSTLIIHDNENTYATEDIFANLKQSNGVDSTLQVTHKTHNQFEVSAPLTSKNNPKGENWALHVRIAHPTPSGTIRRDARRAFSYAIPSAKVLNLHKISKKHLTFLANIEVSTGSRYALHSILFKLNDKKEFEPIEISQSTKWLEPGVHEINFSFDNSQQITEDRLYVGELSIIDYGQLKPVYQHPTLIQLNELTG